MIPNRLQDNPVIVTEFSYFATRPSILRWIPFNSLLSKKDFVSFLTISV